MTPINRNDRESHSAEVVAENVDILRRLFPEALSEEKVDFTVLKELLGAALLPEEERDEKYGLNWFGKRKARQLALTPSTGTLRPCKEDSVDWDTTRNLMIEGDNLEVLKLLQKSYAGKVKLIYIDPPYNTGKDFVYPDNFQDNIKNYLELTGQITGGAQMQTNTEASGRFHTDWLNMMYPRLKLARNLLRDDGMIFVSIDDCEAAVLKQMMSEIYGEENFLAMIAWEKRYTRSNNARMFYSLKDSICVFRKSDELDYLREQRTEESKAIYSNPDNDPRGDWTSSSYVNPATKDQRPRLVYRITNPITGEAIEHPTHAWKYEYNEYLRHVAENRLWWGQNGDAKFPRLKNFLREMNEGMVPIDIWDYEQTGTTDEGGAELKELFGAAVFDNPKPTKLIMRMLRMIGQSTVNDVEDQTEIVLDFFAGSGSTGHAVMLQNKIDRKRRSYILVQLPEPLNTADNDQKLASNFCKGNGKPLRLSEITKERLRRAGLRLKKDNPMLLDDIGFRVFKLDTSSILPWEPDWDNLEEIMKKSVDHIREGRLESDILYELLLKLGLDLTVPIEEKMISTKKVYSIGSGTLIVCLDKTISRADAEPLALGIVEWYKALAPVGETTCVFLDSGFADDVAKTNLTAILNQYGLQHVRSI